MSALLSIRNLYKSFGGLNAVRDLSFSVGPQEILGLIGPNGAGKTTVFNLVMGVHRPNAGEIRFKEQPIQGWPTYRIVNEGIARVFQIAQPMPLKTVYENVEISTLPNKVFTRRTSAQARDYCLECCEMTGLAGLLDQYPGMLPQAGLRRLEIAKAIATDPDLLLLDEPLAGLTAQEVDQLSELIRRLRETGRTIVIVDHNMKGLMRLVDRVVVVNFGAKLTEGTPQQVVQDPAVQEAYLAGGAF